MGYDFYDNEQFLGDDDDDWDWEEELDPWLFVQHGHAEGIYDYIPDKKGEYGMLQVDARMVKDGLNKAKKQDIIVDIKFNGQALYRIKHCFPVIVPKKPFGFSARKDAQVQIYSQDGDTFFYDTEKQQEYRITIKQRCCKEEEYTVLYDFGRIPIDRDKQCWEKEQENPSLWHNFYKKD